MARQFKKVSLSLITSCLLFDFGNAKTPCQNGYDYNHECDPYTNVNFIPVKLPSKQEVARENEALESKSVSVSHISENKKIIKVKRQSYQENKSYLSVLRNKYIQQYNSGIKLQALIDKRNYFKGIKDKADKSIKENKRVSISFTIKDETKTSNSVSKKKEHTDSSNIVMYSVRKGDNLSKIAKMFSLRKRDIVKINGLDKNKTIKIGQVLKIPLTDKKSLKKGINKNIYIVQKGDTLIKIAKKLNISIVKLREINRISRSSHIKVGQKLALVPSIPKNNFVSYDIVKKTKLKRVPFLKYKRSIKVIATAYTSHKNQTDNTPFLAAWNNRLKPGMKIIAVSEDLIKKYGLTNGVKVKISGLPGYYIVRDKMNKRLRNHIDIYMGVNKRKAMQWGRKKVALYW